MTTKELIDSLKMYDPSGNLDVVVGNVAITEVNRYPASFQGWYQRIKNNHKNMSINASYVGEGNKIVLTTTSIADIPEDFPDYKVNINIIGDDKFGRQAEIVEEWMDKNGYEDEKDEITKLEIV